MARRPAISIEQSLRANFFAENDIKQYMGVKAGSDDHQVSPLTSGDTGGTIIEGVALNDADDGEGLAVVFSGPCFARAEGAVTRGDLLESIYDATEAKNGNMKTLATLADGSMIAARAMEDAADGEYFLVNVILQMQLATSG